MIPTHSIHIFIYLMPFRIMPLCINTFAAAVCRKSAFAHCECFSYMPLIRLTIANPRQIHGEAVSARAVIMEIILKLYGRFLDTKLVDTELYACCITMIICSQVAYVIVYVFVKLSVQGSIGRSHPGPSPTSDNFDIKFPYVQMSTNT